MQKKVIRVIGHAKVHIIRMPVNYVLNIESKKGVPSAESSRSVRGLGKGVSGKSYPRLCNAKTVTQTQDLPVTCGKTLQLAPGLSFIQLIK